MKNVPNIPIKSEDKFPSSTQFTSILSNSSNKVRLQHLIEMKLKEYSTNHGKEIIQCTGLSAKNLFTSVNIDDYSLSHAEADTALFTIYNKMRENGWTGTVVIDAEDTDIYVQAAYVSQKVSGELLIKKKNIYVDSQSLFTTTMSDVIIQLHVMTGCDHNCGFYGRGKKAVIEKVSNTPEARILLTECGNSLPIPPHVLNNLKTFVIKYVYGSKKLNCAETRASQWKKMKKKNTQRLMPDDDTLDHICLRANYLAYCQKNFQLSRHPSPIGNGWGIINGKCRPLRNIIPALPADLPSQRVLSDDESSESDIDECSGTDSSESEDEG